MEAEQFLQAISVLDDVQSRLGLIENYLSCLKLQVTQHSKDLVLYSLLYENGLDNMMAILDKTQKDICLQNDFLVDCHNLLEMPE